MRALLPVAAAALLLLAALPALATYRPEAYSLMPGPADLPTGFVYREGQDQVTQNPKGTIVEQFWARPAPSVGTDADALVQVTIGVMDYWDPSATLYEDLVNSVVSRGYGLTPFYGLGEQAQSGKRAFDQLDPRPTESVAFVFKVSNVVAAVQWTDYAGQGAFDQAMTLARTVETRIRSNPPRVIPPTPTATVKTTPTAVPPYTGTLNPFNDEDDYSCENFPTQAEAQSFFITAGGPREDFYRLDGNGNGIACEELP